MGVWWKWWKFLIIHGLWLVSITLSSNPGLIGAILCLGICFSCLETAGESRLKK